MAKPDYYFECLGLSTTDSLFDYLIETLQPTNRLWSYFVDWEKIKTNVDKLKNELNLLNALIGDKDIEGRAKEIFVEYPKAMNAIPILIASREKDFHILENYESIPFSYQNYLITEASNPDQVVTIMKKTGILSLLKNKQIKSIPDYVFGIEVGLDTNARKKSRR
ncbi:MAG: DpnII family type II restriction endonuclease [Parvibaculales bacterium]